MAHQNRLHGIPILYLFLKNSAFFGRPSALILPFLPFPRRNFEKRKGSPSFFKFQENMDFQTGTVSILKIFPGKSLHRSKFCYVQILAHKTETNFLLFFVFTKIKTGFFSRSRSIRFAALLRKSGIYKIVSRALS